VPSAPPTDRAPVPADAGDAVWERVQLARHPRRPHALELLDVLATVVVEIHGDRLYGDDGAIVAGLATIDGRRVAFVGMQKGADTDENIRRNFGMPHPEGYRKGMRVMELAERFGLPVVTLIDVPGAHPGAGSEERGIADSIARSIGLMSRLRTPVVAVITGEGGSGGALALAVADVVIALENAVYSVITPEGCASILWRTPDEAPAAARAMRMSAGEQQELGVVDVVVAEPPGGAHADRAAAARLLRPVIVEWLDGLAAVPVDELIEARYQRFRGMGPYTETAAPALPAPERPGLADRLRNLLDLNRWAGPLPLNPTGLARGRDEPPARDEV
jgi:acetyl-CoA carboxylase carboxyl transferase alpha subunit